MMSRIFPYFAGGMPIVVWIGLGLFQIAAIVAGIDAWTSTWFLSILIWLAIFWIGIPFLGEALTFYGAYAVWHWHWYWALMFAAPGLVFWLISLGVWLTERSANKAA